MHGHRHTTKTTTTYIVCSYRHVHVHACLVAHVRARKRSSDRQYICGCLRPKYLLPPHSSAGRALPIRPSPPRHRPLGIATARNVQRRRLAARCDPAPRTGARRGPEVARERAWALSGDTASEGGGGRLGVLHTTAVVCVCVCVSEGGQTSASQPALAAKCSGVDFEPSLSTAAEADHPNRPPELIAGRQTAGVGRQTVALSGRRSHRSEGPKCAMSGEGAPEGAQLGFVRGPCSGGRTSCPDSARRGSEVDQTRSYCRSISWRSRVARSRADDLGTGSESHTFALRRLSMNRHAG